MKRCSRDDELQHGVAEKFQALIIEMMPLGFVAQAGMGQRFRQQKRIAKLVADAFLERIHETSVYLSERFFPDAATREDIGGACVYFFW